MPALAFDEIGSPSSPALVLLHSGGMAAQEWEPHRAILSERFRLIIPDLPGHGRSPMRSDRLRIREMGEAVLELLNELGVERAHMVGSSLGGATALWLALKASARVDRLVLYRVGYRKDPKSFGETEAIAEPERWRRLGLSSWLSRIHEPQGGPDAWQEVIQRVPEAMALGETDHRHSLEDLAELSHETLVVCGDRDPLVPLDVVLAMARAIPRSALYILPDATHITATNTWRAALFATEVERFLRRGITNTRSLRSPS